MELQILKRLQESEDREQYFVERTNKHIQLVQQAIEKIASANPEWKEFDENELIARGKVHDQSKLQEPERTPYIELTWNKFKGIKDEDPNINKATLYHITHNSHHPEYSLADKSDANLADGDRDKSRRVIDASQMLPLDIAEMIADWQAMAEELKTNTAREWYDRQKNVRWKFTTEQDKLIDKLLKVFEEPYSGHMERDSS